MKTIKICLVLLTASVLLVLSSCKKGGGFLDNRNVLPVTLSILNVSAEALEVKIDTVTIEIPTGRFDLTKAFPLQSSQSGLKLTITEKGTGKPVMEKELKKDDGRAFISFFYINGEVGKLPEIPAVEPGKIKIIYMFRPVVTNYTEPVDIVLGKYYLLPKVFEEITRIKNVKANQFTEPVTLSTFSTASQPYNGQNTPVSFQVYIYKSGTNQFYTEGTDYEWHPTASSAPKPSASAASSKLYIFSEAPSNFMSFTKNLEL